MTAFEKPQTDNVQYILTASCKATTGIVAAVTTFLAQRDCYICALEQFDDESSERFFMRAVFRQQAESPTIEDISAEFPVEVANRLEMKWNIYSPNVPVK